MLLHCCGGGTVPSHPVSDDVPGTSGASFDFANPLHFRDGEDPFDKSTSGSHPLGRAAHLQAFREVVSLITGFFPDAKPDESCAVDRSPWFDDFVEGSTHFPVSF